MFCKKLCRRKRRARFRQPEKSKQRFFSGCLKLYVIRHILQYSQAFIYIYLFLNI
nr:MAG TPA: hypothetical protein [Caudoviricetes sp.]